MYLIIYIFKNIFNKIFFYYLLNATHPLQFIQKYYVIRQELYNILNCYTEIIIRQELHVSKISFAFLRGENSNFPREEIRIIISLLICNPFVEQIKAVALCAQLFISLMIQKIFF